MADIYNKEDFQIKQPFTADYCVVEIDGITAYAVNVQIQYQQPVTRKRTIGGPPTAVIYTGTPMGQISMQRLGLSEAMSVLGAKTFQACSTGEVTIKLAGCAGGDKTFRCVGCVASSYGIQIEADGLTVLDNVTIDFLQMMQG